MIDALSLAATQLVQCLHPIKVRFKEPREFNGVLMFSTSVPCGKCELCLKRRQREWFVRLYSEWKHSETAWFVTFTYASEWLPIFSETGKFIGRAKDLLSEDEVNSERVDACVWKEEAQNLVKRLRKPLGSHHIKYFLVSEYGDQFNRPHFHMIIFNYPDIGLENTWQSMQEAWPYGFVTVGGLTSRRINYCSKYCLKDENKKNAKFVDTFMLCSRRPAIGTSFLSEQAKDFYKSTHKSTTKIEGVNYPLPSYLKKKLFSEDELTDMYYKGLEDNYDRLSSLLDSVGTLREVRKLHKEQIRNKCAEIKHRQELAKIKKLGESRKFIENQKPYSKTL